MKFTDDDLRRMWKAAAGTMHGPNVETWTMPEPNVLRFLHELVAVSAAGQRACDCKSYNGGPCYNCINGAHSICDNGRRVCPAARISAPSDEEIKAVLIAYESAVYEDNSNEESIEPHRSALLVVLGRCRDAARQADGER